MWQKQEATALLKKKKIEKINQKTEQAEEEIQEATVHLAAAWEISANGAVPGTLGVIQAVGWFHFTSEVGISVRISHFGLFIVSLISCIYNIVQCLHVHVLLWCFHTQTII